MTTKFTPPVPMNADQARAATLAELEANGWERLTNHKQCGGCSKAARRIIQRRLRAAGWRFTFTLGDGIPCWRYGMGKGGLADECTEEKIVIVGVTLNHCAHKLGNGDAHVGWRNFWG